MRPRINIQVAMLVIAGILFFSIITSQNLAAQSWTSVTDIDKLPGEIVICMTTEPVTGKIYMGTYGYVTKSDGTNWSSFFKPNVSLLVNSIALDPSQDNVWFGEDHEVTKLHSYDYTEYDFYGEAACNIASINALVIDATGNIWAGRSYPECEEPYGNRGQFAKFDGTNITRSSPYYPSVHCGALATNGDIWFGTSGGVAIIHPNDINPYIIVNTGARFYSIAVDPSGNMWCGGSNGIYVYSNDHQLLSIYAHYNSELPETSVMSIAFDSYGNAWIGTSGKGVFKFDGINWTNYTNDNTAGGLLSNYVRCSAVDGQGRIWFGFYDGWWGTPGVSIFTPAPHPTAKISGDAAICVGKSTDISVELTGTSPWSITYTDGITPVTIDNITSSPLSITVSPSANTTYSLTAVSDAYNSGTSVSGSANIIVNELPTVTGTLTVCEGFTTQLTGSGTPAASDPWISGSLDVALVSNTGLVTGKSAGTTVITFTNNNGCSQSTQVLVDILPDAPTAVNTSVTYDGLIHYGTALPPEGSTVAWYDINGNPITLLSGTDVGTYTAWAESINSSGCKSNSRTQVTVTINPAPLTVKANDATKYCSQINPGFSVTYTGFVNGENETVLGGSLNITSTADEDSGTGTYPITPSGLTSANYVIKFENGVLTIKSVAIDASGSSNPVPVGTPEVTFRATVFDGLVLVPGVKVLFSVENGNGTITNYPAVLSDGSGIATLTITGLASIADVFKVIAVAGSNCGTEATSIAYLAIYDPSAGFVTGGGWIYSPPGAYLLNPLSAGKANFGFVSKYKKGSNIPDGNTEFQFTEGDLNFSSSSYDLGSLVIAGYKAIYRGVGSINGIGDYGFMVSVVDGDITGGGGYDKFRIKIWDKTNDIVVYDNNLGSDENDMPTTILGGGSIVIHKADNNTLKSSQMPIYGLKVYPNPFSDHIYFNILLKTNSKVLLEIYDATGTKLSTVFKGDVVANESYLIDYMPKDFSSGAIIYKLTIDGNLLSTGKLVHQ